jgi:hypothetical protein
MVTQAYQMLKKKIRKIRNLLAYHFVYFLLQFLLYIRIHGHLVRGESERGAGCLITSKEESNRIADNFLKCWKSE